VVLLREVQRKIDISVRVAASKNSYRNSEAWIETGNSSRKWAMLAAVLGVSDPTVGGRIDRASYRSFNPIQNVFYSIDCAEVL